MPEKHIQEIAPAIRERYEKGLAAFRKDNLDYAVSLFEEVLKQEPALYACREALRAAQHKRAGAQHGMFRRWIGAANASPTLARAQMALRSDPLEAIRLAEQVLNTEPHNVAGHKVLAEAALLADLPRTAVLSLEILFKQSPGDREITLRLSRALFAAGDIRRAESLLIDLAAAHPRDSEITAALKDMSAHRTLSTGGYEKLGGGHGSYRDILHNVEEAVSLEQEKREVKSEDVAQRLIDEYETRLPAEPDNLKLLQGLAELYVQKREFDRSLDYYRRLIEASDAVDPAIHKARAEVVARQFDARIAALPSDLPDRVQKATDLRCERDQYLLEACQERAARYPNDLHIRFELGEHYYRAGRLGEAIQEFQRAQANPHRRIPSLLRLGQSFAARGMHDLAARQFQTALKEKELFDEEKKELIYHLSLSLEKLGRKQEAFEELKRIYETDIGYRDVAARVDAYYAGLSP